MSRVTMPNYDEQIRRSHILFTVTVARIDGHTAHPKMRQEAKFDRELGDWVPGKYHTVPKVMAAQAMTFALCQN